MKKSRCLLKLKHPLGFVDKDGYLRCAVCFIGPDGAWQRGYKPVHRLLMEHELGRKLESHEHVRFADGDKTNIHLSNLLLVQIRPSRTSRARITPLRGKSATVPTAPAKLR